jgi:hypothetical protein
MRRGAPRALEKGTNQDFWGWGRGTHRQPHPGPSGSRTHAGRPGLHRVNPARETPRRERWSEPIRWRHHVRRQNRMRACSDESDRRPGWRHHGIAPIPSDAAQYVRRWRRTPRRRLLRRVGQRIEELEATVTERNESLAVLVAQSATEAPEISEVAALLNRLPILPGGWRPPHSPNCAR